jgi:hypothetical protein
LNSEFIETSDAKKIGNIFGKSNNHKKKNKNIIFDKLFIKGSEGRKPLD